MSTHNSKQKVIQVDIIDNKNDDVDHILIRKKLKGSPTFDNSDPEDYVQRKDIEGGGSPVLPDGVLVPGEINFNIDTFLATFTTQFQYRLNGDVYDPTQGTLQMGPRDPEFPRIDLIYGTIEGTYGYIEGVAANNYEQPNLPANTILLAQIYRGISAPRIDIVVINTGNGYLPLIGGDLFGQLRILNGNNLYLRAAPGLKDSGDVVFEQGDGTESGRLYIYSTGNIFEERLVIKFSNDNSKMFEVIHTGNLADFVDLSNYYDKGDLDDIIEEVEVGVSNESLARQDADTALASSILEEINRSLAAEQTLTIRIRDEEIRASNAEANKIDIGNLFESRFIDAIEFIGGITVNGIVGVAGEDYYIRDETTGLLLMPVVDYVVIAGGFTLNNPVGRGVTITGKLGTLANYVSRIDLFTTGTNLFNRDAPLADPSNTTGVGSAKIIQGYYRQKSGTNVADARYSIFGPIPLTPGQSIIAQDREDTTIYGKFRFVVVYSAAGVALSGANGGSDEPSNLFTMPAAVAGVGGAYVYVTVYNQAITGPGKLQINRGTDLTSYQPFYSGATLFNPAIKLLAGSLEIAGGELFRKTATKIGPDDASYYTKTKNLLDINSPNLSFGLFTPSGTILSGASVISDFISVNPTGLYTVSPKVRQIGYFNYGKTWVNLNNADTSDPYTFAVPSNVYYLRLAYSASYKDSLMMQAGDVATEYEPFGYKQSYLIIGGSGSSALPPALIQTDHLGTSITYENKFVAKLAELLFLNANNCGVSGSKMATAAADAMWQDVRVQAIRTTTKIVFIESGTNDWANNIPIGNIDSVNTEEYLGAFNVCIGKMQAWVPNALIIIQSCTFGYYPPLGRTGWSDSYTNLNGDTTQDFTDAAKLIARKYNLAFADNQNIGINASNASIFFRDGNIHPNDAGGLLMAGRIIDVVGNLIRAQKFVNI